ncbi:LysR family transcriptional regulator [Anaeroselena agilis]|uniref:LysR family transcriptional regulator n=1 Tax=Anaeroselena agilis TaxID=3063788 RepID=A0ABU3NZ29_9FIRM|nr:LysR family transcriptional regulator [Selenomonadales bacterium 4137-cl]
MYIKNLQTFLAVARLLNFGGAAQTLNYSQSTVSEHIHVLEEELGARLFERLGKKVFLTAEGRKLLPLAERTVRDAEEIRGLFREDGGVSGCLNIGAAESLCVFWLPPLLKEYRLRHPQVQVNIKLGGCTELPLWLQQNVVDVAFGLNDDAGQQPLLRQVDLFRGETAFVASPEHELAARGALSAGDFAGHTLLLPEGASGYPTALKTLLAEAGVKAGAVMEFGSLEAIKLCVKSGLGVSLLPGIAVAGDIGRGELVQLAWTGAPIAFQARMVFHREKWLSPALAALEKVVLSSLSAGGLS